MKKSWRDAYLPRVCPRCKQTLMQLDFGPSTTTEDHKQPLCKECTKAYKLALKGKKYRATVEGRTTTILGGLVYRTKQAGRVMKLTRGELTKLLRKRTCHYCRQRFQKTKEGCIVIDHVVPLVRGGDTVVHNLVAACWACNHDKGDRTPATWEQRWYKKGKE